MGEVNADNIPAPPENKRRRKDARRPERAVGRSLASLPSSDDYDLTPTGLIIRRRITHDRWLELGASLRQISESLAWWVGDWLLYGERVYGESYSQAMEMTGKDYSTVSNWMWVAKAIEPGRRHAALSHSVHAEVAALEPEQQDQWLNRCETERLTRAQLRQEMRGQKLLMGPPVDREHVRVQWLLLKLGTDMGYQVWVAPDDRLKSWDGNNFRDIRALLKELPQQFAGNADAHKTVRRIDVLWLDRGVVFAAFEIEATTAIYSGLLRMSDLVTLVPQIKIDLYIVAPEDKSRSVVREINRPTFRDLGLPDKCRLLTFERLTTEIDRLGERTADLKGTFPASISHSCKVLEGDTSTLEDD